MNPPTNTRFRNSGNRDVILRQVVVRHVLRRAAACWLLLLRLCVALSWQTSRYLNSPRILGFGVFLLLLFFPYSAAFLCCCFFFSVFLCLPPPTLLLLTPVSPVIVSSRCSSNAQPELIDFGEHSILQPLSLSPTPCFRCPGLQTTPSTP